MELLSLCYMLHWVDRSVSGRETLSSRTYKQSFVDTSKSVLAAGRYTVFIQQSDLTTDKAVLSAYGHMVEQTIQIQKQQLADIY